MCTAGIKRPLAFQRGMTLLELLVVLVIASLLLTLVAPNVARLLPGSELKSFARQSAALLRELRSEALSRSHSRRLQLDPEQQRYRSGQRPLLRWPAGIGVSLVPGEVPEFMRDPFDQEPALVFFPDGSSSGGRLELVGDAGRYAITVDALSGRVWIDAGQ